MDHRSFAESVTSLASEPRRVERRRQRPLPMLLTIDETADLLRTTRRAVYAMVERRQLPGVVRVRRRVLVRSQELLNWLDQKSALSLKEYKR